MLYAKLGANVAVSYHSDKAGAEATVEAITSHGVEGLAVQYDLGSHESIEKAVNTVVEKWGRIDVFVANAVQWQSFSSPSDIFSMADHPVERWTTTIRSNVVRERMILVSLGTQSHDTP